MIRRGHYSSNTFQDSTIEKLLKENMGYLPRVLFFNAQRSKTKETKSLIKLKKIKPRHIKASKIASYHRW
jgi:hypothetical protein